ncbi:DUF418 domain-containing protein [Bradyrhizobium australiense]|uniref:DUF418 domain-containing protein n=1 Tax=Bradyrhizobium australiense TaxID=2721161 RepID=UPI0028A02EAD|nr:DUF418 domain-containing protein [Bradyrhizobium australiense]
MAHWHSATAASPSALLDRRRLHRPWRGIDPLPRRRLYRGRPDRRPGRTPRHGSAGAGLWRWYHRHRLNSGKRLLGWAAPLGRMAFTNYLMQSLIFGWVFYGYGLGLFGRLGVAHALAIGIAIYIGQVFFSAWWLRHYRYGPVEWLWRTLMYGLPQPMSLLKLEAVR